MSFWDTNDLLNSSDGEDGGENSILYTFEYELFFNLVYNGHSSKYQSLINGVKNSIIDVGLFKQHPTNNDSMSHDNLTALVCFSKYFGYNYHTEIWNEIKRQGYFKYDNQTPDSPKKWLHPRDTFYYGILNNNIICYLFLPILLIMMLVGMLENKESTCGKILWFLRIYSSKNWLIKLTFKPIFDILLKRQYGSKPLIELFNIYFKDVNHPIHYLVRNYYESINRN